MLVSNQAKIVQKLKNLPKTEGNFFCKSTTLHLPENRQKKPVVDHSGFIMLK